VHLHADDTHWRGASVIAVAGKPNKAVPLDRHGLYFKACGDLADTLGWQQSALFTYWKEFVLMRAYEQGWPRSVCEWMALNDLYACLDKRGASTPD
jgi:hypothetical protein